MTGFSVRNALRVSGHSTAASIALLLLRLIAGSAFILHGWQKVQNPVGWMGPASSIPGVLQFLAAISEFGGGIGWVSGFLTPLASLGIASTMTIAVSLHLIVLKDPFVNLTGGHSYELALVYLGIALLVLVLGPGKFSLDRKLFGERI
ncbi:MAG: DoxX family protein [Deltaproteobacteria bacterium]|nr:DoxX family protein [Deltaproteobacteria bacterium]